MIKTRVFHEAGRRLTLRPRGPGVDLDIDGVPILSSVSLGTERAFGTLAGTLATRPNARVVIGGLGFGSTLRAALRSLGPAAEVLVVERLETVVTLLRGPLSHLAPGVLDDPRVRLVRGDVGRVIACERDLDVILLDVDNGPEWASFPSNARLYGARGLREARAALRPRGAYAVWSGYPMDTFMTALRRAGFTPSALPLMERGELRARAYVGRTEGGGDATPPSPVQPARRLHRPR